MLGILNCKENPHNNKSYNFAYTFSNGIKNIIVFSVYIQT